MDSSMVRKAYADFLAVAEGGGFGPPPPGEWDAEHILAHMYTTHAQITATALAVIAGTRPVYDNRTSLEEWNLRREIDEAGSLKALIDRVRWGGELHCTVMEQLTEAHAAVQVPVLIVSNDELIVDEPWPLRQLAQGIGVIHLPRHADQLRSLLPVKA
jgi:hypothetical protein